MSNIKEETPIPDPPQPGSADLSTVMPPRVDSAGDYLRASSVRIKGAESGMPPVVAGLPLLPLLFRIANGHFPTAAHPVHPCEPRRTKSARGIPSGQTICRATPDYH